LDPTDAPRPSEAKRPSLLAGSGLVLGLSAVLYLTGLGWTDLWAPDEPRYAAIAEELRSMRHGLRGLFLLHVNDAVYTQKPPLWFWLAALAGVPGGRVDAVAARLPSALAALASLALAVSIGRQLRLSPRIALLAAALLATSYRFVFVARRAQLDGVLTTCLLAGIALFLWVDRPGPSERDRRPPVLRVAALHLALGAGALTKGPVAWLPLAVFAAFLAWERRIRDLRRVAPTWALAFSVAPLALWAGAAVAMAPPGYFDEAIVDNVFGRFFSGIAHARPFYYFVLQLPIEFLPWSGVLPAGLLWLHRSADRPLATAPPARAARFLICWIALPFLFLSLSAGKRGLYLLPILPALAIATAAGLDALAGRRSVPQARANRWGIVALGAVWLLCAALFLGVAPVLLEPHKSPRPLAEGARAITGPEEVLGVYRLGPLEPALTYYGVDRVVGLSDPGELDAFARADRGPVLLRTRDLSALADGTGLREVRRFRRGRRSLSLARPTSPEPPWGRPRAAPESPRVGPTERTRSPYALAIPPFSRMPGLPQGVHLRYSARGPDPR